MARKGKLIKVPAGDREVHVQIVVVEGKKLVEARDFFPDTKSYGRGLVVNADNKETVAAVGEAFSTIAGEL